jgi:L-lactate dehydrogenase complex protein LldG
VTSRDVMLASLRRNAPPAAPSPAKPAATTYPDPEKQFADAFVSVGGKFVRVPNLAAIDAELQTLEPYSQAHRIASLVPADLPNAGRANVGRPNVDLSSFKDQHELEGIDFAIIPGEFGVAENGAVWVPGSTLGPHRAIFVVTQHLALIVQAGQIVHNMQEAYDRIRFERPGFGVFISGPSKTADIEQALVIGAHGARSCTLFLVG